MLINYVPGEECRIAMARDGRLEEFYQERASTESHVGNIYKGRVMNVEPSIQAAFVDFGLERNGFLHISDLHPMYFPGKDREEFEEVGSKTPHRERPPIQKCLRRGQEILVQVLKEGLGTKGPTLTSYLSIPGRFLVMMPYMQKLGVSRKVEDDDARRESRKLLAELNPPEGFGFIVRTAGIGQTKTDLKRDLAYLHRLWKNIERSRKSIGKVGELYTESDLVIRTIRDVFSSDISKIYVDDPTAARRAHDFLTIANPRSRSKVIYYNDPVPLFHRHDIERQIDSIHAREVPLPSGGYLVIDQTEALVAIDVNSGKSRDARDAESNAFNTNKEAVDEIARQLRLRDLGGVVVLDLIDMRDLKHRKQIEQRFRTNIKGDRARTRVGAISQFGLLEMTRQRMRPSLKTSVYTPCGHCTGQGLVKSPESVVLDVMRRLALVMQYPQITRLELTISPDVAFQLLNRKRAELVQFETRYNKPVMVRVGGGTVDFVNIAAFDARGPVDLDTVATRANLPAETDTSCIELEGGELPPDFEEEVETSLTGPDSEAAAHMEAIVRAEGEEAVAAVTKADEQAAAPSKGDEDEAGGKRKRRRRRRRGGRGRNKNRDRDGEAQDQSSEESPTVQDDTEVADGQRDTHGDSQTQSPKEARADQGDEHAQQQAQSQDDSYSEADGEDEGKSSGKRRRRRRGGRGRGRGGRSGSEESSDNSSSSAPSTAGEDAGEAAHAPRKADDTPQQDTAPRKDIAAKESTADSAKPVAEPVAKASESQAPATERQPAPVTSEPQPASDNQDDNAGDGDAEKSAPKPKPRQPRRRRKTTTRAKSSDHKSAGTATVSPSAGYSNQIVKDKAPSPKQDEVAQ